MIFYSHVFPFGNKMFVRGYENGRPFQRKIDFFPTLYVNSKNPESSWKTLTGTAVEEIKPGTVKETREFVKQYDDVRGFDIYGNTNYVCQYISDTYESDIRWDMEQIKVFTLDIETQTESGFPDIKTANEEVTLITVKDLFSKRIITFGVGAFVHNRDDLVYINCATEQQLLKEFIIWWQQNYPDVITGWNTEFFDIPYLVKRIERELGETIATKLSPWGYINERKTFIKGNEEIHYDIHGISHLDYLALYKKFT
jgi:DNA polymerase elongation subunit (family B)